MNEIYWFIFFEDRLLLHTDGNIPLQDKSPINIVAPSELHRLPDLEGTPCRALNVSTPIEAEGWQMVALRATYDLLSPSVYAMAGKAREILHWDACTRFCGHCGGAMQMHTDISKCCTVCGREVWPWLSTAIIVAITRQDTDEILLVQSNKFRGDYLGLVAGFVETGETLEDCVRREVMEETNLTIKDLQYVKSQAWPYPRGLMAGFRAHYAGGELRLQRSELNKGGWFGRDNMPAIPGEVSLARQLIDMWLLETAVD